MKLDFYMQQASNVFAENRLLKIGFGVLLLMTVINSVIMFQLKDRQQTHIVPVGGQGNFVLAGNTASDDYLKAMAQYIVLMQGNVSPATAKQQFSELLSLYHPSVYGEAREHYKALSQRLEHYKSISYAVSIQGKQPVLLKPGEIQVSALRKRIVSKQITHQEPLVYHIHYQIEQGRFWIKQVEEEVHDA